MAARHRNRNARALANLDALIERARGYGVAGLRAFVRDLQADWERKVRAPEGRIDAAEHAIEVVTIHKAKGLEWPVVIPINSTTELYRPDQFVHRQSDNTLHWMIGGVAPPDLAAARTEESQGRRQPTRENLVRSVYSSAGSSNPSAYPSGCERLVVQFNRSPARGTSRTGCFGLFCNRTSGTRQRTRTSNPSTLSRQSRER